MNRGNGNRGSANRSGMGELERLLHLFVSLQIMFGSRRGGLVPLLVIGLIGAGWLAWTLINSPANSLERADELWNSGVSTQRIEAIPLYKGILLKKDPLDMNRKLLTNYNDRARLYRRIIEFHVKYDQELRDAWDWVVNAWEENIRDLNCGEENVEQFYRECVDRIRARGVQAPFDSSQFSPDRFGERRP